MIRVILQSVMAIFLSLLAAVILLVVVEVVTLAFHPFPQGTDTSDHAAVAAHVARFPSWILAIGTVGWGATVLAATWIATRLGAGRHPAHGIAMGSLLFLAAVFNMYMLPYPMWFEISNGIVLSLAIYLGVRAGRLGPQPARGEEDSADQ